MPHDIPGAPGRPDTPDRPERHRDSNAAPIADAVLGRVQEPYQRRLDRPDTPGGDTPRHAVRGFDPERAGLGPLSADAAEQHVTASGGDRPWLDHARYVGPDTRRVLAALDRGGGHALERHGSTVTPERTAARVTRLEDPAVHLDTGRTPGRDAYKSGTHACGDNATRITDPHAFAACFVRGIEHPAVRQELDRPCRIGGPPARPIEIPLSDLLGPQGYAYCDGHRLDPVGGSSAAARDCRAAWVDAIRNDRAPDAPEPTATRLEKEDFRNAKVVFAFRPNQSRSAWEVATMYVDPVKREP
ncbi:MAG TPA: hypothetical protein VGL93_12745 [Streptosporangiaceae bacterium]|jgi:hypothetical protein